VRDGGTGDAEALRESHAALERTLFRLELVNAIVTGIAAGQSVNEIVTLTLQELSRRFPGLRTSFGTIDGAGVLVIQASVEPQGMARIVGLRLGLTALPVTLGSLRAGDPVSVDDLATAPELAAFLGATAARDARAVLNVPCRHADRLAGVLCFQSPVPRVWEEHEVETLKEVARNVALAIREAEIEERRRAAEESLREAKEFAERLIETAHVMVLVLDPEGRIQVANRAVETVTGYRRDELIGQSWFEVVVPRTRYPRAFEAFLNLASSGESVSVDSPLWTKSGELRLISWRNGGLRFGDELRGTISFGVDITESKRGEEEQRRLQEAITQAATEWQLTFDSVEELVVLLDPNAKVLRANRAVSDFFGKPYAQLLGRPLVELSAGEPWTAALELVDAVRAAGSAPARELREGERTWIVSVTATSRGGARGARFVVTARDIARAIPRHAARPSR